MNSIDFFESTDEIRTFVPGMDPTLEPISLFPSFLTARSKIQEVISKAVYDYMLENYPGDDSHEAAYESIKGAIASYSMYKYKIFDAVTKNGSDSKLYKYQLDEIKEEYISIFWASMDNLLTFFDKTPTFGEWNKQPQYEERLKLPIKSASEFNFYFSIDSSPYFFQKIQFLIRKINEEQIVPRVGEIDKITSEKLKEKAKRALCYHSMAEAVLLFDVTELPRSIRNDVAHEYTKGGTSVQTREKLNAIFMNDVESYYLDIERAKAAASGVTENIVNQNRENDKIYFMS